MTAETKVFMGYDDNDQRIEVSAIEIEIPDLWHLAMNLLEEAHNKAASDAVLKCWHAAHHMKTHIVES